MIKIKVIAIVMILSAGIIGFRPVQAQSLVNRVNEAFRFVYGRNPQAAENTYWAKRVLSGEKNDWNSLVGAMSYQKSKGLTVGTTAVNTKSSSTKATAAGDNKQQLIKDVLPVFINIYGSNPSNAEKAWWRKRISCNEIKTAKALISSMQFHKQKNVRKGKDTICGQTGSSEAQTGVTSRSVSGLSTHPMGDQVRIGIYGTDGSAISLTSSGKYQIREGGSKILSTLGKDDVVQVSWSDGKYHVRGSGVSFDTINKIRLVPLDQAVMQIKSYSDPSATYPGKNYNRFRGIIEIRKGDGINELWAINELRTEYYLRGLAETSGEGPEEYLKALSIAARTYVLYHKAVTGGRSVNRGYDIGKTAADQIYRGYEYEIITPRMATVFNKVKGIIVADSEGDTPVSTVYFSDSDGRTRSAKEAWNTDRFPHLQKSVSDPHHVASSCKGHCVGMSAQGAYGFANKDGWSYQKILKYFYQNIRLVKAY